MRRATDPAAVAAELIGRGHDPERVRRRLGITVPAWADLRRRTASLVAAAEAARQQRLAAAVEARLARAARGAPKAALAYARLLEQRRLSEARRRATEAELGGGRDDFVARCDQEIKGVIDAMPAGEFEVLGRVYDKIGEDLPFDPEETEMAARMYRLTNQVHQAVTQGSGMS